MAKMSALKWLLATAGGAVVGALAIRAMDKYVLSKEKKEAKELESGDEQSHPQQLQQGGQQFGGVPVFTPVMIPFPTPFAAPTLPPLPAPPTPAPAVVPTTAREPEEDVDVLAEIEEQWELEEYG